LGALSSTKQHQQGFSLTVQFVYPITDGLGIELPNQLHRVIRNGLLRFHDGMVGRTRREMYSG